MQLDTFWQHWISGWVIARQIKRWQPIENGYCFVLNDGRREREWLLFSPENLTERLAEVSNRDYCCVSGIDQNFVLPAGWKSNMTAEMMICEQLTVEPISLPENFSVEGEESENRVALKVFNAERQLVCEGQAGFSQGFVVYDYIATEPPFRRQGFGRLIMALLTAKAAERGISQGLLCASEMGKWLYLTLGWRSLGQYLRLIRDDYSRD